MCIPLNANGVNAAIKGILLSDEEMLKAGLVGKYYFGTEHEQEAPDWSLHRCVNFPKEKCFRNCEITFYVRIPKNGADIKIDVIDDDFGQPYDYQYILQYNPEHRVANIVKEQVEQWMQELQTAGVITGYVAGMYI